MIVCVHMQCCEHCMLCHELNAHDVTALKLQLEPRQLCCAIGCGTGRAAIAFSSMQHKCNLDRLKAKQESLP